MVHALTEGNIAPTNMDAAYQVLAPSICTLVSPARYSFEEKKEIDRGESGSRSKYWGEGEDNTPQCPQFMETCMEDYVQLKCDCQT